MEQAVLACCILNPEECLGSLIETRFPVAAFYKPSHQTIYETMTTLHQSNQGLDELTLVDALTAAGSLEVVGGHEYIIEFTNRIDVESHLPRYREALLEKYQLRQLAHIGTLATEKAYQPEGDVGDAVAAVEQRIMAIQGESLPDTLQQVAGATEEAVALVNHMIQNKGEITGVPTGFPTLNGMTSGLQPGDMIVVAARPSMGKTSIALNMCEAAMVKGPVLFFSLEMSADQLALRLICARARVNMTKLRDGFLNRDGQQNLTTAAGEIKQAPLYIDDDADTNISVIRAKARRMARNVNIKLLIIDYLQLIHAVDRKLPREQQVSEISRNCKAMAKELKVPVIILAQLNRECEKEKRQPRASDLRESGSVEQDADIILLISKPWGYTTEQDEEEKTLPVVPRDLIVAKHRNGPVGPVHLEFNKTLTKFMERIT